MLIRKTSPYIYCKLSTSPSPRSLGLSDRKPGHTDIQAYLTLKCALPVHWPSLDPLNLKDTSDSCVRLAEHELRLSLRSSFDPRLVRSHRTKRSASRFASVLLFTTLLQFGAWTRPNWSNNLRSPLQLCACRAWT